MLWPKLNLQCLTIQRKNVDADEWTVNMAAGVCLAAVAQVVKDDVVQFVMPFVEANITSQEWKHREAAVLAFGSILEGPGPFIEKFISQAIGILLQHLKDQVIPVRDTTAWTIASILKVIWRIYWTSPFRIITKQSCPFPTRFWNACVNPLGILHQKSQPTLVMLFTISLSLSQKNKTTPFISSSLK